MGDEPASAFGQYGRSGQRSSARQNDPYFGEFTGLCFDLYRAAVLLDDDIVTD